MSNPWLSVPLAEYEGHMNAPQVRQSEPLSDLFAAAIAYSRPGSVAVLGIAGGNGLARINPDAVTRVVGVDINQSYLDAVQLRYSFVQGLELYCIDLAEQTLEMEPVQLVHAALIFEHAGMGRCLENAVSLVAPGGALSVVLQLPSETEQAVSKTQFTAIQNLQSHFRFISPQSLEETLERRRFHLRFQTKRELPGGKGLWMGIFG
jgi:SAM-dependent methyltransferase